MNKIYKLKATNEEVLTMYYSNQFQYLCIKDIKKLFKCGYALASTIITEIKCDASELGEIYPVGYVPFDRVLDKAGVDIERIERGYKKQRLLQLKG